MPKKKEDTAKTKKQFLEALANGRGNVSVACVAVNISRQTFYRWRDSDKDFAEAVENIRESLIDKAEDALMRRIDEGDTTSIIFYLKTQGKKRGYIEKQELNVKEDVEYHLKFGE